MKKKRRRPKPKPTPLVGALAFGNDPDGVPRGSEAFGGSDEAHPLRGALLFGNAPDGGPRGAEAVGGSDTNTPLRGALLVGNDPEGQPRGAEAFGKPDNQAPLRGALLFGNDPEGEPRGALAFGNPTQDAHLRGSQAFGGAQVIPERLFKDDIGYDFKGVLLQQDDSSIAGVRKHPMDRLRARIVRVLGRILDLDVDRLRQGIGEDQIKWGKLKRDTSLDREMAEILRRWYRKAPGERLGIGHVRDALEENERMHTFDMTCDWERSPITVTVLWEDEPIAVAEWRAHKEHTFFVFKDTDGNVLGYLDTIVPRHGSQRARIRAPDGELVAAFELTSPGTSEEEDAQKGGIKLEGVVTDARGKPVLELRERRASPRIFIADMFEPGSEDELGTIQDKLDQRRIRTHVEVDLHLPQEVAWALAILMADLARLRRDGWPDVKSEKEEYVESVEEALGKPRGGGPG